ELWDDVPLHLVAARLRPRAAPADDDEGWDEAIARARMQAASPKAPSPPPLPPAAQTTRKAPSPPPRSAARDASRKAPSPPPFPQARGAKPRAPRANPDLVGWGGLKKPTAAKQR